MPQRPRSGRGNISRHTHPQRSLWKRLYVSVLMALLSLLVKLAHAASPKVRAESDYVGEGFTLTLKVDGSPAARSLERTGSTWRGVAQPDSADLVIAFRDLDYAYDVFSGAITLQDALAARLFTTHGPNDKGVAVTYLFTVILKAFFGWRACYRR